MLRAAPRFEPQPRSTWHHQYLIGLLDVLHARPRYGANSDAASIDRSFSVAIHVPCITSRDAQLIEFVSPVLHSSAISSEIWDARLATLRTIQTIAQLGTFRHRPMVPDQHRGFREIVSARNTSSAVESRCRSVLADNKHLLTIATLAHLPDRKR